MAKYFNNKDLKRINRFSLSYMYPVIFDYNNDGILVFFPDLPGVFTYGHDEEHSFFNAREALGLHLFGLEQDQESIPLPSRLYEIKLKSNQATSLVDVDMSLIRNQAKSLIY
ncbi:type II toxin-antitoxin system HicB family antitoxin [Bacillus weihaiensis]|uniref:type II toxin-antitoxin system HicB family antitoxin n=1 Tax=Bacillus weihaiensis TaxID=1547283 RepID=UPI0023579451|nr:type II toxin-antitoxin system HicB family antitoxin [Bacillus weihaiensis]